MKTRVLITMISVLTIVLILIALFSWYRYQYSMEVIEGYEVNDPTLQDNILIATQGSEFKTELTKSLVSQLKLRPAYIKVIDVTSLDDISTKDWDAIIIIHTWEYYMPQKDVGQFLDSITDFNKIIVVTTTAIGKQKMEEVDGISSASLITEIDETTSLVVEKVAKILE